MLLLFGWMEYRGVLDNGLCPARPLGGANDLIKVCYSMEEFLETIDDLSFIKSDDCENRYKYESYSVFDTDKKSIVFEARDIPHWGYSEIWEKYKKHLKITINNIGYDGSPRGPIYYSDSNEYELDKTIPVIDFDDIKIGQEFKYLKISTDSWFIKIPVTTDINNDTFNAIELPYGVLTYFPKYDSLGNKNLLILK